jgi:hypothetical protein
MGCVTTNHQNHNHNAYAQDWRSKGALIEDVSLWRNLDTLGGMPSGAGARAPDTAPRGRVCAECDCILSVYNLTDRCSLHRSARDTDQRLMACSDDAVLIHRTTEEAGYQRRNGRVGRRDDWW